MNVALDDYADQDLIAIVALFLGILLVILDADLLVVFIEMVVVRIIHKILHHIGHREEM